MYRSLGAARFFGFYGILLTYVAIVVALQQWLGGKTGWPEAYGDQCHGRGCWASHLWHSFGLLGQPDAYHLGLFTLLWHLPLIAGVTSAVVVGRRWRRKHRNRIRPMAD